jgi:IS66 Orf2 like protein
MIPVASGVRVWIATSHTDMRRGMNTLALQVQEALRRDPHGGDLYVFRGKSGKLIKILWHDGLGTLHQPQPKKAKTGRRPRSRLSERKKGGAPHHGGGHHRQCYQVAQPIPFTAHSDTNAQHKGSSMRRLA